MSVASDSLSARFRFAFQCVGVLIAAAAILAGAAWPAPDEAATSAVRSSVRDAPRTYAPPASTQPAAADPSQRLLSSLRGSAHDFTLDGELGRDLCLPCHTPHLVSPPAPLLDPRPEAAAPLRGYQAVGVELNGWSLVCLGCHDGVTASDVYTSSHAVKGSGPLGASRLPSRGLRSHPVGVLYPASRSDYHSAQSVESAGLPLPEGRIQCTTCHDAHNTFGHPGMLRISDDRSRLCLTCHNL